MDEPSHPVRRTGSRPINPESRLERADWRCSRHSPFSGHVQCCQALSRRAVHVSAIAPCGLWRIGWGLMGSPSRWMPLPAGLRVVRADSPIQCLGQGRSSCLDHLTCWPLASDPSSQPSRWRTSHCREKSKQSLLPFDNGDQSRFFGTEMEKPGSFSGRSRMSRRPPECAAGPLPGLPPALPRAGLTRAQTPAGRAATSRCRSDAAPIADQVWASAESRLLQLIPSALVITRGWGREGDAAAPPPQRS